MNETLEHHGILGMKWGVRRYQNKDGTWTEEGKEHRNPSVKDCKKEYNELRKQRNAYYDKYGMDLPEKESKELDLIDERINNLIEGRYSEAVFREYNEKQPELIRNRTGEEISWRDAFGDSYENTTKSNRHSLVGLVEGGTGQYRFKSKTLGHSDESEDDIASDNSSEDILEHHGILGMKWGIRRYQNSDGSLTAAGRKRYGVDENDGQRSSSGPSSGDSSNSITRTPAKSASEMTDQELNQALNRLRMEQQYNELTGAKSSNQYQNQQNFSTPPSNTGNLSNAELQAYITRLDMEKRYAQLTAPPPKEVSAGQRFMKEVVGPAVNQVAKAYIVASLSKALGLKGDGDGGGNNNNNNNNSNGGNKNKGNNNDSQYNAIKKELNDLKSMMGSQRKQDNSGNQKKESSSDRDSESNNSLPEPRSTETRQSNTHRDSIFAAARDAARNASEQKREREQEQKREREQRRQESREKRERRNAQWSAFLDGLNRQTGGSVDPVTKSYKTRAQSYFDSYLNNMGR